MTPIEPDLKLLPRKLFQAGEFAFMQVALPFPDKNLIALPEAKGAGRLGERGASIAAGKISRRLHQRRRRKVLRSSGRSGKAQAQHYADGNAEKRPRPENIAGAGQAGAPKNGQVHHVV
jgi:hypothetical protein